MALTSFFRVITVTLSILCIGAARGAPSKEAMAAWQASVVQVEAHAADASAPVVGSGVVVANESVVVPCHLVRDSPRIIVRGADAAYSAALRENDKRRDLCALAAPGLPNPPVRRGAGELKVRQPVHAVAVFGKELVAREGKVVALRPFDNGSLVQIDVSLPPEASGGGLFDNDGNLVGVLAAYLANEKLNFALPLSWIDELPGRAAGRSRVVMRDDSAGQLARVRRATQLQQKEDWRGLLKFGQGWVKADRANRQAWLSVAVAAENLGQHATAASAYLESLRLRPMDSVAWSNLCFAYGALKRNAEAVRACEIGLYTDPDSAVGWFNLGVSAQNAGAAEKAVLAYRQTVRLDPSNSEARRQLEVLERASGKSSR